jgi:hypothetical protein
MQILLLENPSFGDFVDLKRINLIFIIICIGIIITRFELAIILSKTGPCTTKMKVNYSHSYKIMGILSESATTRMSISIN